MKKNNFDTDIVILGCGLSGMITALALAKYNIYSTIIENKSISNESFFDDIRTTALNAGSKDFFKQIEVWNHILALCGPINDIYVVDNKAPEMLHFSSNYTYKNEIMGYLIENTQFKKCLYKLVKANKFITISDETKYQKINNNNNSCELILSNDKSINCKLLIVCEGRSSKAKNLFFSNQIESDYRQKALTFIVEHEKNHEGTAVEHFMPNGPFAILPLKDEYRSSIVWTLPIEHAAVISCLPIDEFTYLVQENFGPFLGKIQIKSKIASFYLKAHIVRKYYNKKIVLLADTAHIIHPLAGQGLNQGIKDIKYLSALIAKHGISENTLEDYQQARQNDNMNMLLITETLNNIFSSNSKILSLSREIGFKFIEKIPPLKKLLINYAMGKR